MMNKKIKSEPRINETNIMLHIALYALVILAGGVMLHQLSYSLEDGFIPRITGFSNFTP